MSEIPKDYAARVRVREKAYGEDLGLGTHVGATIYPDMFAIVLDSGEFITTEECTYELAVGVDKDVNIRVNPDRSADVFERPDHDLVKSSRVIPKEETVQIYWFEAVVWNNKPMVCAVTKLGPVKAFVPAMQLDFAMYGV